MVQSKFFADSPTKASAAAAAAAAKKRKEQETVEVISSDNSDEDFKVLASLAPFSSPLVRPLASPSISLVRPPFSPLVLCVGTLVLTLSSLRLCPLLTSHSPPH